ncbi:hypothetical protein ACR82Z_03510 [Mycoplasma sp. 6243]|uniref:hypothetical protein n=1 Tax=Mycoplasma sp. 6243 TaxID=3440865 RepID=UPI003EC1025F
MKIKKALVYTGGLLSLGAAGVAVSCGTSGSSQQDTGKGSKKIYIAVDGAQKDFYNEVKKLFDASDSHTKDGFTLEFIQKGVFDALNLGTQGLNDPTVPDIFYLPQDRVTEFAQNNYLADLDTFFGDKVNDTPKVLDDLNKVVSLPNDQKADIVKFGTINGTQNQKPTHKFLAVRHNKEGLILASNKDEADTRAELTNKDTDTLKELVEKGKLVLRLQDFWYGNGILYGGIKKAWESYTQVQQDELGGDSLSQSFFQKNLYKNNEGQVSSWFVKGDKWHGLLKDGLKEVANVLYPIIHAAYGMTPEAYKETVWAKNGLSQGDLQAMYGSDMGVVNQTIFSAMKDKKLDYALIGTWDVQNSRDAANALSFFNVVPVDDGAPYIQAAGGWGYGISSRNNGSSPERKKALEEVLKAAFNFDSYYQYFKQDSKIPYSEALFSRMSDRIKSDNTSEETKIQNFSKNLGYADFNELNSKLATVLSELNELKGSYGKWGLWESKADENNPIADANQVSKDKMKITFNGSAETKAKVDELNNSLVNALPLRNTLAGLMGFTTKWSDELVGSTPAQPWQLGADKMKAGAFATLTNKDKFENLGFVDMVQDKPDENGNNGTFHLRKIEQFIFGVNGDDNGQKVALIAKIQQAMKDNKLQEFEDQVFARAKFFSNTAAPTTVSDEQIRKIVKLYLAGFENFAKISTFADDFMSSKMQKKDGTLSDVTIATTKNNIDEYNKSISVNFVFNVLTSSKKLQEQGLGILQVQPTRFDNSNPNLKTVWSNWNDKTFGSAEWYRSLGDKLQTQDKFLSAMEDKLSADYTETLNAINSGNLPVRVVFK